MAFNYLKKISLKLICFFNQILKVFLLASFIFLKPKSMRSKNLMKNDSDCSCLTGGMNRVLPGLYIGSFADANDLEQLEAHNITHILSLRSKPRRLILHPHYLHIPISDTENDNIAQYFSLCNNFIHKARLDNPKLNNVLVHCYAGVSRSATIIVAYLMTVAGLNWRQALKVLYNVRHIVQPNVMFIIQLRRFQVFSLHAERYRLYKKFPTRKLESWDHWRTRAILSYSEQSLELELDSSSSSSSECDVYYDCSTGDEADEF